MAETAQEDFKEEKKGSGKSPLLLVILVLNIAAMGGIGFMQWKVHEKISNQPSITDIVKSEMKKMVEDQTDESSGEANEDDGILFPLDGFTANLAQGDGPRRFLRLNAVLKFSSSSSEEEFKARKPQIRDTIINLINSKRPEDLLKVEGKNYLKEEIKAAINSFLINGNVIDVFYVSFQIN